MRYVHRELEAQVRRAVRAFPALVLTGPRRAGKTCLLRHLFAKVNYFLLEDPDVVARLRADPQGFLDAVRTPVILDEVQNVPEVFAVVRARIDHQPRRLTASRGRISSASFESRPSHLASEQNIEYLTCSLN
jgi:uncharacterized protein